MKEYTILRFGTVTNIDAGAGRARVRLAEEGIITPPLGVASLLAGNNKALFMPALNEQVAVLLDSNFEAGVIIGGIYSASNTPNFEAGQYGYKFEDGSEVTYKDGTVTVKGATNVVIHGASKVEIKNAVESLGAILDDLMSALQAETHISAAPGSPTTVPVNVASYIALQARLAALLA